MDTLVKELSMKWLKHCYRFEEGELVFTDCSTINRAMHNTSLGLLSKDTTIIHSPRWSLGWICFVLQIRNEEDFCTLRGICAIGSHPSLVFLCQVWWKICGVPDVTRFQNTTWWSLVVLITGSGASRFLSFSQYTMGVYGLTGVRSTMFRASSTSNSSVCPQEGDATITQVTRIRNDDGMIVRVMISEGSECTLRNQPKNGSFTPNCCFEVQ